MAETPTAPRAAWRHLRTGGAGKMLRTGAHLTPSQIYWRARFAVARQFGGREPPPAWDHPGPPGLRPRFPGLPGRHNPCAGRSDFLDRLDRGEIELLGRTARLDGSLEAWRLGPCETGRLLTITLHYHEWLAALAVYITMGGVPGARAQAHLERLLTGWFYRCHAAAPGTEVLVWNTYAAATRIIWWVYGLEILGPAWRAEHPALAAAWLANLWQHAGFVAGHLERDLRANHLLRDVVALAFAGRFLAGPEADGWLATAEALGREQIREQVLPSGAHYERSPMYHLHAMEDILALALLLPGEAGQEARAAWERMAGFAAWLEGPAGLPLLQDSARNGCGRPAAAIAAGQAQGFPAPPGAPDGGRWFADAGYFAWRRGPLAVWFDAGAPGPPHQPGHAHAGTLGLIAAWGDSWLFEDAGVFHYDRGATRDADRSTAAHNTVTVDGENSAEVWEIFRVGRRPRITLGACRTDDSGAFAEAEHDGFANLPGGPIHRRGVAIHGSRAINITDTVEGGGVHEIAGGWLIGPAWDVTRDGGGWAVRGPGGVAHVRIEGPRGLAVDLRRALAHPGFHAEVPAHRLVWQWRGLLPVEVRTLVTLP